jgi:alcohol dehydrogenase class IV
VTWPVFPDTVGPFTVGRLPRITFGSGTLAKLPALVVRHGRRALFVHGLRSFASTPRYASLVAALEAEGIGLVGTVPIGGEPGIDEIEAAAASHRDTDVDVVLSVGGGSVLDAGKAIAALLRSGSHLLDHLEVVGRGLPYQGPALPVVAVPTTAGTGSEATRNAVITRRGRDGFKRSFRDERLVPAEALVDPDLLAGAPRPLIAANGLDAVTQLLESYTSPKASPFTDALALHGLAAARDGLLAWHRDPEGEGAPAARAAMALAALLSGICLAQAGLGAVHGLASPLGALLPIPHGTACGLVLWQTVAANISALEAREAGSPALARYATVGHLLGGVADASDADAREALVEVLRAWVRELEMGGLADFGLRVADIDAVVSDAADGSTRTNPIALTSAEMAAILRAAM